jgi:hypothetical protein
MSRVAGEQLLAQFGTSQGFTPVMLMGKVCPDGLYASATALALTELRALPQMRAK